MSVVLTAKVRFRNVSGYLLAKGRKFQKLAKIIQHQHSMNESVQRVGGTMPTAENEVLGEKPVPVPLYPP
jgi:hypothetical protein